MYPPPDRAWPSDRAVHGSRTGVVAELDATQSFVLAASAAMGFVAAGYELANKLLSFYMSDVPEGSSFDVPGQYVDDVIRHAPKVSADEKSEWLKYDGQDLMECAFREILNEAYHNAQYSGKWGETQSVAPNWMPAEKLYGTGDLENALGGFYMTVAADVVVHPPQGGQPPAYEMMYCAFIFDQYFFHDTAKTWYGKVADHDMRVLEETGHARSFITRGRSPSKDRSGRFS